MSALLDDAPVIVLPEHLRRRAALRLVASDDLVEPAGRPGERPTDPERRPVVRRPLATAPVRLTHRGVVVLGAAVAVLAAALVTLAWLSAPAGAGSTPAPAVAGDTVAVAPGDSLWSIAGRVAPGRDPREEVALLQRLNHLDGPALVPGQVLRVR